MRETFSTIVVPLDLEPDHDRAVPVAGFLADVGHLPISLLTVSSPGMPDQSDQFDLRRAAEKHQLDRWSAVVLHDNEPARAIAAHLATLDSPLVVMASGVRTGLSGLVSSDTSAQVLSQISCPALILGPNVSDSWLPARSQLLSCVGPTTHTSIFTPAVARWVNTFGGDAPSFVTMIKSDPQVSAVDDDRASEQVRRLAQELFASSGIKGDWKVLRDDDPVDALLALAELSDDAILVVTSERWPDGSRLHSHSVSRRLAQASTKPVLVIPHAAIADS